MSLLIPDNYVGLRDKEISEREPLAKSQLSNPGSGSVHTFSSNRTSSKNLVSIFIPLIVSNFVASLKNIA